MNNGWEEIQKEADIAVLRYCPTIYMEDLRKTTRNLSMDSERFNQDFT
jgi:hypothetical protein